MSMCWYPGDGERFEISVDDPGDGRLHMRRLRGDDDADYEWIALAGGHLGVLAREVLTAVIEDRAPVLPYPLSRLQLTRDDARLIAASVQQAVLLAAAGTDRYDRIHVDPDDSPAEALCSSCSLGSPYTGAVTISERCLEHGHQPFGERSGVSWADAVRRRARPARA
ncbi:hypothetical protein [Actinotalea sp. JY-7876]|uniref:hypothetical protein n=1 Tax=Actinotalea sp. JY-7876 TaxID=2758442 RepID=UPI0015F5ADAD|nr:hypothetical protein [Actinotalea sp. JY-7876]